MIIIFPIVILIISIKSAGHHHRQLLKKMTREPHQTFSFLRSSAKEGEGKWAIGDG